MDILTLTLWGKKIYWNNLYLYAVNPLFLGGSVIRHSLFFLIKMKGARHAPK